MKKISTKIDGVYNIQGAKSCTAIDYYLVPKEELSSLYNDKNLKNSLTWREPKQIEQETRSGPLSEAEIFMNDIVGKKCCRWIYIEKK